MLSNQARREYPRQGVGGGMNRRPDLFRGLENYLRSFCVPFLTCNHRHTGFDDAGLFAGDFGQRVAEPFLVVELDIGDDARERGDDVGGIETAAKARFPNDDVAFLFGKPF